MSTRKDSFITFLSANPWCKSAETHLKSQHLVTKELIRDKDDIIRQVIVTRQGKGWFRKDVYKDDDIEKFTCQLGKFYKDKKELSKITK